MFSKILGVSAPHIRKATIFLFFGFMGAYLCSAYMPAYAAVDIWGTPISIGEGDNTTLEVDMSGLHIDDEEEPAPGARPSQDTPRRERPRIQTFPILSVSVEGNSEVVSEHILSVVTSRVDTPLDQNRLARDADSIYELGFFSNVDYRITDELDGVNIIFIVTENPIIDDIYFFGNTTYSEEVLKDLCFTKPGMIFNRVFFRNDLQRIREKYQQDGYVMTRVSDVRIEDAYVNVFITEPMLGNIVIQGNNRTRTYVIERQLRLKAGDLFNASRLRFSLTKLQGLGYFSDVSVGFEQGETDDLINLILTVTEAKTGRIGISVGYGTESGFGGGLSYSDSNFRGRGENFGVGFDLGKRQQYWLTLDQPYMDQRTFSWRAGVYLRNWDELKYYESGAFVFDYDEERLGGYVGIGRKFSERSKLNWFLTSEWQKIDLNIYDATPTLEQMARLESGTNFTVTGRLTRDNIDEYAEYVKGDIESVFVEKGIEALGGDWDYWKYWIEGRYYTPLNFLTSVFERNFTVNDIPPVFALRAIAGDSSGFLPWAAEYSVGGDNTLRGYEDKRFRGNQMFLANAELRLPVHNSAAMVFFYDWGMAWDTRLPGERFDFGDLAEGYGLGLRVRTPLGNLRFDFANGRDESRFHFGFGEMF